MAFENNVQATLQANVAIGATTVDVVKAVAPNKDVPVSGRLTLSATGKTEIISYTGRTDNTTYWTLTGVTKNAESSFGDQAWSAGDACFQALTAADVASLSTIHSATAPTNPTVGTKWFNTTTGVLQEYLTDGTDFAWLDISAGAVAGASGSSTLSGLSDTTVATTNPLITSNPSAVGHLWVNSTNGETYVCTDITVDANTWINTGAGTASIASHTIATGGTVTTVGGYNYHTFTTSSSLVVATVGVVDYMIVAGGGGGGSTIDTAASTAGSGGGGGGGFLLGSTSLSVGTHTIIVGAGGTGQTDNISAGSNGINSIGFSYTAIGGGVGGGRNRSAGGSGGSGGGGTQDLPTGGAGTTGQGFAGGDGVGTASPQYYGAGGGGGATQKGGNGVMENGGNGGAGAEWPTSSGSYYAGGGGAGGRLGWSNAVGGTGGIGGGGTSPSDYTYSIGEAGAANTGGGGAAGAAGSSGSNGDGGNGGSGIVIVRYPV